MSYIRSSISMDCDKVVSHGTVDDNDLFIEFQYKGAVIHRVHIFPDDDTNFVSSVIDLQKENIIVEFPNAKRNTTE